MSSGGEESDDSSNTSLFNTYQNLDTYQEKLAFVEEHGRRILTSNLHKYSFVDEFLLMDEIRSHAFRKKSEESETLLSKFPIREVFIQILGVEKTSIFDKPFFNNFRIFNLFLVNLTDHFHWACKSLGDKEVLELILRNLSAKELGPIFEDEPEEDIIDTCDNSLAIINNILKANPASINPFRQAGGVEVAAKFLNAQNFTVKTEGLRAVAYGADLEESQDLIRATESNIKFIVEDLLQPAINSKKRRFEGYSVEELLESLALLSRNESNAIAIHTVEGLNVAHGVIKDRVNSDEVLQALNLVRNCAFISEVRKPLKENSNLRELLEELKKDDDRRLSAAAESILWEVHEKDEIATSVIEKMEQDADGNSQGHVMISYNWTHQSQALEIREELRRRGVEVWMDVEKMEGDMLARMAEAVEDARVIITCLSEQYRDSANCRREASYALQLKKPVIPVMMVDGFQPRGWLGLLVGMNLYYKLHDEHFPEEFPKMFDALRQYIANESPDCVSPAPAAATAAPRNQIPSFASWSNSAVINWISGLGLSRHTIFEKMDGSFLVELKCWQANAPAYFLSFLEKHLVNPIDVCKFSMKLRGLK